MEAVFFADFVDFRGGGLQIQTTLVLQTQNDVLRGGEYVYQLEVLMDHADAVRKGILGGGDGDGLAVHQNFTFIREVDTGQHIHQRGFSAAVFAQQGQNFPLVNIQGNVIVGDDLCEALGNVFELNRDFSFQIDHPFCHCGHKMGKRRRNRKSGALLLHIFSIAWLQNNVKQKMEIRRKKQRGTAIGSPPIGTGKISCCSIR